MTSQTPPRRTATTYGPRVATVLFAISIFIADTGTLVETAFAVLYVVFVLMACERSTWTTSISAESPSLLFRQVCFLS